MSWLPRIAGFALVPLSLVPLVAAAPLVAPSATRRIAELRADRPQPHAVTTTSQPARHEGTEPHVQHRRIRSRERSAARGAPPARAGSTHDRPRNLAKTVTVE